ncbi:MAG: undecaprenyl-diphosphate phosphatase [Bacteroidales bacterium]
MSWFEALILGLLQGLTEFLPVSSSGHLELSGVLFGLEDPQDFFTFNIIVHGATFLSVVVVFWRDIVRLIMNFIRFRWNPEMKFILLLMASAIPTAIVGLLFEEQIARIFEGRVVFVGFMLLITATLLILTRYVPKNKKDVTLKSALVIGLAQTLAVLPGISRSGATISTALYFGIERGQAVRFSFLMVLIPIFGANFLKLLQVSEEAGTGNLDAAPMIIGAVTAFIAGVIACRWMLSIVRHGKIEYFAIYCLAIGLAAIATGSMY